MPARILVVDDDPDVLGTLVDLFSESYNVVCASSGSEAIEQFGSQTDIAAIVMDIKMAEMDGIEAARRIKEINAEIPVIFHTGCPGDYDEDEIDENEKPFDYVLKGNAISGLSRAIRNAVENYMLKTDAHRLTEHAENAYGMIGKSEAMRRVFTLIASVSRSDSKVIIKGETGTGKELVARAVHFNSHRKDQRLAILNCNHKSPDLIESELFGHVKGAFTGAIEDRIGLFEYADGGSVFLDEIGDLDVTTQAKLLRVLETGEYQRLGEPDPRKTDCRVICATHRNLEKLAEDGMFREDLYYRLRGIVISLPPLREHKEDIPLMVRQFADRLTVEQGFRPKVIDSSAMKALIDYDWPGNVRQLFSTIDSSIALTTSDIILADDIRPYIEDSGINDDVTTTTLNQRLRNLERTLMIEALTFTGFNVTAAARTLGIDRSNLQKKIASHGIDLSTLRKQG